VPQPSASRVTRIACAPGTLPAQAALHIVECERARLPDLTHAVVVLPGLTAAANLARALRHAAGAVALLLPRITTLSQWAAQVPLDRPVTPRAAREALLYEALAERGWLATTDLWAVAGELAGLFDELTRHAVALPATVGEFSRQLERAYRAKRSNALQFEARLVHELWHLVARDTGALDSEAAYQLRLAALAGDAAAPLYAVGLTRRTRAEDAFLERYAECAPVYLLDADPGAAGDGLAHALHLAWPAPPGAADLITRAALLKQRHPASPCSGRVAWFGAASAEQEAQAVDVTVREWLLAGNSRIAVVINDRLTARRARALLERAEVLVRDEAGWAFSTTSAATVIGRWLDCAANDCYHRDLLDLLKSPFALNDWPRPVRQQAVWRFEGYVREANAVSGLARYVALAERNNDAEVRQILVRVQRGLAELGRGRRPLARWVAALQASLEEIGVRGGLAADRAGEQLLDLLSGLADDLAQSRLAVGFAEWRRWLARELEAATFSDRTIESPVVFTSLAATWLRTFDAVLIVGADAAHLPGADPVAMFFNQGVRAELGLPTRNEVLREIEEALAGLIAGSGTVLATWQRFTGGEQNLLSPQFERLAALHRLAYGAELADEALAARLPSADVVRQPAADPPDATVQPAPRAPAALLPQAISASGYNALMACPYQFLARYLLGLAELDDVQEMIEKADYGRIVHAVLKTFHAAHSRVLDHGPAVAHEALERLSEEAFAGAVGQNYLARAWLERWRALIPEYLDWQRAREAEGWRWYAGEETRDITITTPNGARLVLRGRIDRVDQRPVRSEVSGVRREPPADGAAAPQPLPLTPHEYSVIDYKTARHQALRRRLDPPGEDVQLLVYALLWGGPVAAALFLSLERGGVRAVELGGDLAALAAAARDRLAELFDALRAGAPLPAQGAEAVCEYCEMRGLCRRNYWP